MSPQSNFHLEITESDPFSFFSSAAVALSRPTMMMMADSDRRRNSRGNTLPLAERKMKLQRRRSKMQRSSPSKCEALCHRIRWSLPLSAHNRSASCHSRCKKNFYREHGSICFILSESLHFFVIDEKVILHSLSTPRLLHSLLIQATA